MKADVIDACGEVASSIPDDPVLALCTWFVEGCSGSYEQIEVERLAIAYYQEALFVQVSPQRQQTARRWWRRAGFPLGGLTHGLTPEEKVRFEAADRALRYPGWLRAKLAGVITFEPAPWVRLWELAPALLLERQPAPMTRIWVPPGVPHRLARH